MLFSLSRYEQDVAPTRVRQHWRAEPRKTSATREADGPELELRIYVHRLIPPQTNAPCSGYISRNISTFPAYRKMAVSNKGRVLVVDDEPLVRFVAADALREAGYEVVEASNADDAMAMLKQDNFTTVLTDMKCLGR
jgi:hypothetical protein